MNAGIFQTIIQAVEDYSWVTFFMVFLAGAVISLGSSSIVRVPVAISFISGAATSKRRAFLLTLSFVLALLLSYILLGVMFGLMSGFANRLLSFSRYFYYMLGILAFLVGARMAGLIRFEPSKAMAAKDPLIKQADLLGAFLFGVIFAIFETSSCPPHDSILFTIAGLTFVKGKVLYAVLLFLTYALGQSLPLLLVGSFTGIMKYSHPNLQKIEGVIKIISGNILIASAFYFFLLG